MCYYMLYLYIIVLYVLVILQQLEEESSRS